MLLRCLAYFMCTRISESWINRSIAVCVCVLCRWVFCVASRWYGQWFSTNAISSCQAVYNLYSFSHSHYAYPIALWSLLFIPHSCDSIIRATAHRLLISPIWQVVHSQRMPPLRLPVSRSRSFSLLSIVGIYLHIYEFHKSSGNVIQCFSANAEYVITIYTECCYSIPSSDIKRKVMRKEAEIEWVSVYV